MILVAGLVCACGGRGNSEPKSHTERAQKASDQGRYQEALEVWNQALESSPGSVQLRANIAIALQRQGRFDESIRMLKCIVSEDGEPPLDAYVMLAENLIGIHHIDEAEALLAACKQRFSMTYRLLVIEGDCKTMTGRLEQGEASYREAIAMGAENPEVHFRLAANLFNQHRVSQAEEQYRKALETEGERSTAFWLHQAEYLTLVGRIAESETALQEALKAEPNSLFIKLKMARVYKAMHKDSAIVDLFAGSDDLAENQTIRKIVAESLLNLADLDGAHKILRQYADSKEHEWTLLWGKYYLIADFPANAVSFLERAMERRRDDQVGYYLLAIAYMAANKNNLAQNVLIRLLSTTPEYTDAELALAGIYYKKGNYDLSIEHLNRIISTNPGNYRAYCIMGGCLLALGRLEEAELQFQKALMLNDRSIDASYFLALAKKKQGKDGAVLELLESLLESHPRQIDALLQLVDIHLKNERPEAALESVEKRSATEPNNGLYQLILGKIYQQLKDHDRAKNHYRLATTIDQDLDVAYENRARMTEDVGEKRSLLLEASRHNPQSVEIKTMLAGFHLQEGEFDKAIKIMEDLHSSNKSDPFFANNLAWLYLELGTHLLTAFDLASSAYEADSHNPSFAHTLGVAYHRKRLFQQAEWYLRYALSMVGQKTGQPTVTIHKPVFEYHLALLLMDIGQFDESKELLRKALEGGLPERFTKNANKLLKVNREAVSIGFS